MKLPMLPRSGLAAVAASVVLFAAGCAAAHQLDLPNTTWQVTSLDDESLDAPTPSITFSRDGNSARLILACGEVDLIWAWDTDGSAIGFGAEDRDPGCVDPSASDAEVLDALTGAEEWSVQGDSDITIRGERVLRLTR